MQPQLEGSTQQQPESNRHTRDLYRLYAGGLIVISLILLQDFLNLSPLDTPASISVLAFSVALPLLSATSVLDIIEKRFRARARQVAIRRIMRTAFVFGVLVDLIGIDAAFWHLTWLMGMTFLVSLLATFVICGIYILSLDDDVEQH